MEMDKLVSLCKRRGFLFQSSEIYGGLNELWDYGPIGVELKRNIKEAWWRDMVTGHYDIEAPPGAPEAYEMCGLDCTIIMHPQVWKVSGHYDLFVDKMVDCTESKKRYRYDQVPGRWVKLAKLVHRPPGAAVEGSWEDESPAVFVTTSAEGSQEEDIEHRAMKFYNLRAKDADALSWQSSLTSLAKIDPKQYSQVLAPDAKAVGTLTAP